MALLLASPTLPNKQCLSIFNGDKFPVQRKGQKSLRVCRPFSVRSLTRGAKEEVGTRGGTLAVAALPSRQQRSEEAEPHGPASTCESMSRRALSFKAMAVATVAALGNLSLSASPGAAAAAEDKTPNLSIEELKNIIERDIRDGQYFITGDLTKGIYRDDCRFKDPTNETVGLTKYLQAVSILFDPKVSKQELLSIEVTGPNTIEAKWTLGGYLKFPWRPRVVPFEGSTQYTVDPSGLISLHNEKWGISPFTALLETLTPSFGPT